MTKKLKIETFDIKETYGNPIKLKYCAGCKHAHVADKPCPCGCIAEVE